MTSPSRSGFAALVTAAALAGATGATAQQPPSLDAFGLLVAQQSRPSFSIIGAGARAAGMGGAFTALADDASAVSFNPAGLALLLRPEATVVLDRSSRRDDHAPFVDEEDGVLETYSGSASSFAANGVNFAAFTLPFTVAERNLAFQLSFHRPIDFGFASRRTFTESTEGGAPLAEIDQEIDQDGDVSTLTLAAAYQVTGRLSLGLALSRWDAGWSFATTTSEREADEADASRLTFRQSNAFSGWGASGGLLLRYRWLDVGAAFRAPFDADLTTESSLETSFPTPFPERSRFSGTLEWPGSWSVGIAAKPRDTWIVTTDYTEYDWDDMVILGLDGEPVSFFDLKPVSESLTRNTGVWRYGTELTFFRGRDLFAVRAGGFVEPRPQLLTASDESNRTQGWSIGMGWNRGPISVDAAWQRGSATSRVLEFVDPETVASGSVGAQAEGEVETTEDRFFVSFLYQFDSKAALRRLGHFLFVGPLGGDDEPAEAPAPDEGDDG